MYSIANVHADQMLKDFLFKSTTLFNLTKKLVSSRLPLTNWGFNDCTITVDFLCDKYLFYIPKGYDFNIFLNPYFHEYDITQLVHNTLATGDVFVDVGAHGGLYTVIAALRVGETGKVLSLEPNPANLSFLRSNIKLNKLNNVSLIPEAADDKIGRIQLFYSSHDTALTSASKTDGKMIEVDTTTIDETAEEFPYVKIIKIDTEGHDLIVLKGGLKTLKKVHFVIIEQNSSEIRNMLSDRGFILSTLKPSGYLLGKNPTFDDD
jgi:FkbM family methyltransferase